MNKLPKHILATEAASSCRSQPVQSSNKPEDNKRSLQPSPQLAPILFLGDHFGYASGVVHGVTIYFLDVLPALKRAGVDVTACYLREAHPAAQRLAEAGITPIFLAAAPANPFVVSRVAAIARQHHCRIIHAAGMKATLVARLVGRILGIKVIVHLHDLLYPKLPLRVLHKIAANRLDTGICLSSAAREVAVKGYHVDPSRVRVIHNGIRLERFNKPSPEARLQIRQSLALSSECKVLVMVGRFYPIKGHRGMIDIMSLVARSYPQAILLLVGDGPERPACEELASQRGLQNKVIFLGSRNDVPELLAAADVVVVPSLLEGLSLVAIEAIATGKPVVAFDAGGLREVVTDGWDGRIIPPRDHAAFAAAIVALLNDPELLKTYGERAQRSAQRFSLEHHVAALLACYRELADGMASASDTTM